MQLQHVQVFFRHGARTPYTPSAEYENFSNIDAVDWSGSKIVEPNIDYVLKSLENGEVLQPESTSLHLLGGCIAGDLTKTGQQEAQDFGKWLNEEYIARHNFISPMYNPDESMYIRSTNLQRTTYTAIGVIEGLYGKKNILEPLTIWTLPDDHILGLAYKKCPALKKRMFTVYNTVSIEQENINKEMGIQQGTRPLLFVEISDLITSRKHHGLLVPQYLLEKEWEIMENAMTEMMNTLGNTVNELRDVAGALVDTICNEIEGAIAATSKHKFVLYSSHDTTVLCLQNVLGNFERKWPPYLANVIFELYNNDEGKYYIRVLYNKTPLLWDEDGNKEYIPSEKFMKLVENYRVRDWISECGTL